MDLGVKISQTRKIRREAEIIELLLIFTPWSPRALLRPAQSMQSIQSLQPTHLVEVFAVSAIYAVFAVPAVFAVGIVMSALSPGDPIMKTDDTPRALALLDEISWVMKTMCMSRDRGGFRDVKDTPLKQGTRRENLGI